SSRRRHTRWPRDWSSDVCSSDLLISHTRIRAVASHNVGNVPVYRVRECPQRQRRTWTSIELLNGSSSFYWRLPWRKNKSILREQDRKSTRLNSSHVAISYAVFCL